MLAVLAVLKGESHIVVGGGAVLDEIVNWFDRCLCVECRLGESEMKAGWRPGKDGAGLSSVGVVGGGRCGQCTGGWGG